MALSDQRSGHGHPVHPPSPALPFPLEVSIGMWRGWGPHLQGSKILRWGLQPRPGAGQGCQGSLLNGCTWPSVFVPKLPPLRGSEQDKSSINSLPLWTRTSPMSGYHLQLKLCHPANYSGVCVCVYVTRSHVVQAALNLLWG